MTWSSAGSPPRRRTGCGAPTSPSTPRAPGRSTALRSWTCSPAGSSAGRSPTTWSQADLANKIDSDARQVSRYEGGKVAPGLDTVVRIAETFDVTVDYLVLPDAPRRPLHAPTNALADQLAAVSTLPPDDQAALLKVLDALVTKTKLRALTTDAS